DWRGVTVKHSPVVSSFDGGTPAFESPLNSARQQYRPTSVTATGTDGYVPPAVMVCVVPTWSPPEVQLVPAATAGPQMKNFSVALNVLMPVTVMSALSLTLTAGCPEAGICAVVMLGVVTVVDVHSPSVPSE